MTPPAILRRIAHQQGRRGGVLTLMGIVWILIGVGVVVVPMDRFSRPGPGGPLEFADHWWTGLIWIACGLIAAGNGALRRRLGNEDAIGYAALIFAPALWTGGYVWSFITWLLTRTDAEVYGRETAFLGVFVYGVLVAIIRIIAKWPDDFDVDEAAAPGSSELALLDRMHETKPENDARGARARADSEEWISSARAMTEERIAASAAENDRMIASDLDEQRRNRDDGGDP